MSLFRSIRAKIRGIFVVIGLLFMASSAYGLWQLNSEIGQYQSLIDHEGHALRDVQQMEFEFATQVQEWKSLLIRGQDPNALQKHWEAFLASEAKVQEMAKELEDRMTTAEDQALIRQAAEAHAQLGQSYRAGLEGYKASGGLAVVGDSRVLGKDRSVTDRLGALATKFRLRQQNESERLQKTATQTLIVSGGAMILSVLIAAYLIFSFITKIISRRLSLLVQQVELVGKGDFRPAVVAPLENEQSPDEIGELTRAFISMHETVRNLLGEMTRTSLSLAEHAGQMQSVANESAQAAHQVAEAMGSVAAGASTQASSAGDAAQTVADLRRAVAEIATGAQEQAAAVEQAGGTVEQMLAAIGEVAQNSAGVAATSIQAGERAAAGAAVVKRTIGSMNRIEATVQSSAAKLAELGRHSAQIGEITNVITEIADQTNLLALNAAIEAARAGEHGRGFAVVADEVRKLAERAAKSASEITGLVQTIQTATGAAIRAMEQGTAEVQEGAQMATEAGEALTQILTAAESTTRAVQEISVAAQQLSASSMDVAQAFEQVSAISQQSGAATQEMAAGAEEVTGTITRVAEISQENAASAEEVSASVEEITASTEEVASAAQQLQQIANALRVQVQRFRL